MSVICLAGLQALDWEFPVTEKIHPSALLTLHYLYNTVAYFKKIIITSLGTSRHLSIYKKTMEISDTWISYSL